MLDDGKQKWPWLLPKLKDFVASGSVLIFVSTKAAADELSANLKTYNYHCASIHGDKDMQERSRIMFAFKNQNLPILVATDVAGKIEIVWIL